MRVYWVFWGDRDIVVLEGYFGNECSGDLGIIIYRSLFILFFRV